MTVRHVGPPVPSMPHIAMTVRDAPGPGVEVDDSEASVWRVLPGPIAATDFTVEPDLSNAAPFFAAAMVTGGSVTIPTGRPRPPSRATGCVSCSPTWARGSS